MKIKFPPKKKLTDIIKFFKSKKIGKTMGFYHKDHQQMEVNEVFKPTYYPPDLKLLYRLYQLIVLNKRTTLVEFGSGWSTIIFASALNENKKRYTKELKKLRRNNPFELFVLEDIPKYRKINIKNCKKFTKNNKINIKIHWLKSKVKMVNYNGMFATEYQNLPLCSPDFIYLDGPSQFSIKNKINNFSTAHKDIVPIGCDILKIEYFLTPGTIIVVDGRSANAKFLKDNFKRNWKYFKDPNFDQYVFLLDDPVLGRWNRRQLDFYKK